MCLSRVTANRLPCEIGVIAAKNIWELPLIMAEPIEFSRNFCWWIRSFWFGGYQSRAMGVKVDLKLS